jgi:hypothetical protein
MLYRSTDRLCRCGAAVKNLAHSAGGAPRGHWLVWATAWMGFGTGSGFWWAVLIVGASVAIAGELMGFILWLVPR